MPGEFELRDQLKRAVLSISTNIAEGIGREKTGEKKHFLGYAKGSVFETVSLIMVMKRKKLCSERSFTKIYSLCEEISKMLFSMISSNTFL
ncbi:four helix bundle protein [Candidatus Dependentiae bacterium]|nr:four helix bundle protein [Candidatus Dependentiae bacterium]